MLMRKHQCHVPADISGFDAHDGSLMTAPGSHHFHQSIPTAIDHEAFASEWLRQKVHIVTGQPLRVKVHAVPRGTVLLQLSHVAHAVSQRSPTSGSRYALVLGFRNPGAASGSRRVTQKFVEQQTPGLDGMKTLDLSWPLVRSEARVPKL